VCDDPSTRAKCIVAGKACTTTSECCGDPAVGSQLDCVASADGKHVCRLGQSGDACDEAHHCTPGLTCIGAAGSPGDGGTDGGTDGGSAASDGGAKSVSGTCGLPATSTACTLYSSSCNVGDSCDPKSMTNQGYDPCYYGVVSQSLSPRSPLLACNGGFCTDPVQGQPCSLNCVQTAGDPRKTACLDFYDGSKLCMPSCASDTDCDGATAYDAQNYNPQPATNYCVNYGAASGCQPVLCFAEGQPQLSDPSVLYNPCAARPGTICVPQYTGSLSAIVGYCMAVRPNAPSTVGQVCNARAGREATLATCGRDAICLGGRCEAICDASQLGRSGTPKCDGSHTCISPQNVNLIADYQVGGCGDPCDPFADLEHSQCANYCGGPPTRCNWIVGDPVGNQPRGYCGAALEKPILVGQACQHDAVDPCEPGARCLLGSDGVTRVCTHLCDPSVDSGNQDACPSGLSCTAFTPLKRSGYCQ
jgi:hypothetical protein